MRVVVTGGAGFIGANLVRHLVERGHQPIALDNLSTGFASNLDGVDAELMVGDLTVPEDLDRACEGADAIVHLGARPSVPRSLEDPFATHHANATGTLMVLEAARRHGDLHTVVASSSSVYGANATLPKSEDLRPEPISPYAVSKLAAESYALAHQRCFGLPTLAFRFFNVFGPLQRAGHAYAAAVPAFLDAAMRQQPVPVHGDGSQSRDFTFVGSVTEVLAVAVERGLSSDRPVNLAFGTRHTLLELVQEMSRLMGRDLDLASLPDRPGDVKHSQADGSRLARLLPEIAPVPLDVGLRQTIDWFATAHDFS